jgi:hypothetical protein
VGLHALALGALIYLTPVRQIVQRVVQQVRPEEAMSGRGLADLAEAIELRAADQIADNTEELQHVLTEMDQLQSNMSVEFQTFDAEQRSNAAQDAQKEMEKAVAYMQDAEQSMRDNRPIEATDRLQALAEQAQERAQRKLDIVGFDVAHVVAAQQAADSVHQAAKASHDRHRDQIARVAALDRALTTEQQRTDAARSRLDQLRQQAKAEAQVKQQEQTLAQNEERTRDAADDLQTATYERDWDRVESVSVQEQAVALQEEALTQLRRAVADQPTPPAGAVQTAAGARRPSDASSPGRRQGTRDLAQLYDEARRREDDVAGTFKEVRAMDLAMVRDIPLPEARGNIEVVRPVRPDLDAELLREGPRTGQAFDAHKEEVRTALRETESMVRLAHRMLEMATQSVDKLKFGTGAGDRGEELTPPEFQLIIRELAMEDISGRFADMAGMMEALQREGDGDESAAQRGGRGGALRMGAGGPDASAAGQGEGEGEGEGEPPPPMPLGPGSGGFMPPALTADLPAVGARKISPGGEPSGWMYINTWYTLGPFPNPNRVNIDKEFPPDSMVDLDAVYVGKDGRTIRWQFVQSDKPMIVPAAAEPYGIWYAYSEFVCDKPRDILIALGTDDYSILKVNGILVWYSAKQHKSWQVDEVFRRVHLNQGVNRILYRVENGHQSIGFSLVLRLEDGS